MPKSAQIIFTVTNDLTYDQRMQRICSTLAGAGYQVTLVGRLLPASLPLRQSNYKQVRLKCRKHAGKLFYLEFNWRLYHYLRKATRPRENRFAVCAIDLDTIIPVLVVSKQQRLPRAYDAHELFSELTEVKRRPAIYAIWKWVEKTAVPQFRFGYTVNQFIAAELNRRYGVSYEIIRNLPVKRSQSGDAANFNLPDPPFLLYQGAVNEGRAFENLIPAMVHVKAPLVIAGDGNFFNETKALVKKYSLEDKVIFLGYVSPDNLRTLTPLAYAGITLFDNSGLNQYYSLANRFFDYMQGGIPQLCVAYPEYETINQEFETALLIKDLTPENIAAFLNKLLEDNVLYKRLQQNCVLAAEKLCWENESQKLLAFWNTVIA